MKTNHTKKSKGYIALMATIVISLVLLVMTVEQGSSGWYSRFNILGTESKEQANALAEGCAEQAQAILLTDPSFVGNLTINSTNGTCNILPIAIDSPTPGLVTIKTQGIVNNSYANLSMVMEMNDLHLNAIPSAPSTGTIFVTIQVINDSSGSNNAGDVTVTIGAVSPSINNFAGSESGTAVIVQPTLPTYSVSASALPNYSVSRSNGCDGTGGISAGEVKFCTITYNDITTTLTVIANVKNDNGGTTLPSGVTLSINGTNAVLGTAVPVSAGTHTVSAVTPAGYASSAWGYDCSAGGNITILQGQNKTCVINFDDLPPPAPSCADTVMILDRTGSMSSTDRANERVAANSLVDLYAGVLPPATPPQLGVGSIGGLDGSAANVPTLGQLTTIYNNLKTSITSMMNNTSSVGSDLSAGINVATNELNSARHISGKNKVLILVSDGDPNEPSGSVNYDTGFKSANSNNQNTGGELWSNPIGAYNDLGTDTSDPVSENDRHQFGDFGFGGGAGLPSGGAVRGIEVSLDAWATAGTTNTPANSSRSPSGATSPNQWTNPNNAFTSNNSYATNSTNGQAQGYSNFGFSIPSNATITGIQVTTEAITSGGGALATTTAIFPSGQGTYTSWSGDEGDVDETNSPDCSSNDSVIENNSNDRESVNIDLSSIPNGATITNITVLTYDRGDSNSGGTYKTFARLDGTNTDAGLNLTATGTSGCNQKSQIINVPDTVKSSGTDLEVGVMKVSGNNNTVRVGAIRAQVTYTQAGSGTIAVSLSSNNGGTFTATKNVAVTGAETSSSPSGNSSSDMWGRTWIPADFNNGNFVARLQNNSTTGVTVSVDQIIVNVFYTTPVSSGAACQIEVDLSWNNGSSWTSTKTQTINGTETTYVLGSATDDWTSSHSWTPTEFSNANFKTRVRAVDPGSGCDSTAVEHIDWLQAKVYYRQSVDPVQAALNSADTAKLSGIDIFTIHFGGDVSGYNGKELLANLASGNTAVSSHQNGSLADVGGSSNGNTGQVSPTAQSSDSGGDGNGFEVNPNNAFADGPSGTSGSAQNINGPGDRHRYSGYNFVIPPGATITGIQTRLDWWVDSTSGTNTMNVELSWNGGATWTSAKTETNESTSSSNSRTLGASNDTWGRTWSTSDFSNTNFRVRVTSNSSVTTRDFYLDWIPVTVSYSVNTENSDGDNFFVAPTSADMQGIFNFIGEQVCPASLNLSATPPPTTGTIIVLTNVTNNNGGSLNPADFTGRVNNANNPSATSFAGDSVVGVAITVNPGGYNITQDGEVGYTTSLGATCSADAGSDPITAGETRVCVINNDDIPPPPPPPNLNFNTNSWQETPN